MKKTIYEALVDEKEDLESSLLKTLAMEEFERGVVAGRIKTLDALIAAIKGEVYADAKARFSPSAPFSEPDDTRVF